MYVCVALGFAIDKSDYQSAEIQWIQWVIFGGRWLPSVVQVKYNSHCQDVHRCLEDR